MTKYFSALGITTILLFFFFTSCADDEDVIDDPINCGCLEDDWTGTYEWDSSLDFPEALCGDWMSMSGGWVISEINAITGPNFSGAEKCTMRIDYFHDFVFVKGCDYIELIEDLQTVDNHQICNGALAKPYPPLRWLRVDDRYDDTAFEKDLVNPVVCCHYCTSWSGLILNVCNMNYPLTDQNGNPITSYEHYIWDLENSGFDCVKQ